MKIKEKLKKVSTDPGVYLMKNEFGDIIYIGKSKCLKNRLKQYFQNYGNVSVKTAKLVSQITDFEYIITNSEYEALVLECNLIKIHNPKYNILLKDSKGYHYIKITNINWPRMYFVANNFEKDAEYLGPYMSFNMRNLFYEVCSIFKIATCNREFFEPIPVEINKKNTKFNRNFVYKKQNIKRPCLNYYINKCSAPCYCMISKQEYSENFNHALDLFKNGNEQVLNKLKQDMYDSAENKLFEKAAKIRDIIRLILGINDKQKIVSVKIKEQDVVSFVQNDEKIQVELFEFRKGNLCDTKSYSLELCNENMEEIRSRFIVFYYSRREYIPENITVDGNLDNKNLVLKYFLEKLNKKVTISVPKEGDQFEIVNLCSKNALENLNKNFENNDNDDDFDNISAELARILNLKSAPKYIESYDISNISGKQNVGVMVVFKDGVPLKSCYRKFKIKEEIRDDYSSIREVLMRRFKKLSNININFNARDSKFSYITQKNAFDIFPDLILIDGGMSHTKISRNLLRDFKINIPVFGMVKDDKHRTRDLTSDKEIIKIRGNEKIFRFITKIQNEVHRFAVNYHRKLRDKRNFY
ncbi:MAG: excinuclease ABC subunit UvrC [Candidatus Improbicoccus devescovinae]|nr:MAG: excinuclease ABC subunit UvrC [Candidatus Improbicoccus devescovinae]